jgi:hypothetical protein
MRYLTAGAAPEGVGGLMGGQGAGNAPGHGRKRLIFFIVACALLAAPLLIPSAAQRQGS